MTANTVLKTIHVAVRDLGLDNDTRRPHRPFPGRPIKARFA